MTIAHEVLFPRYDEDVIGERRTLFHALSDGQEWRVGDRLRLLVQPNFPRCKIGVLIDVRQVQLLDELDADITKLGSVDRAAYLASWDKLHLDSPSCLNPTVWRIEFRYGKESDIPDPPEWSMAG